MLALLGRTLVRGLLRFTVPASVVLLGCSRESEPEPTRAEPSSAPVPPPEPSARLLYLPDADAPGVAAHELPATEAIVLPRKRCPLEMVDVQGQFCIDRFEASLVNVATGESLSPYYHPTRAQTRASFARWQRQHTAIGPSRARIMAPPVPPEWQLAGHFVLMAASLRGVVPNGYMNRLVAEEACANAGKRLCTGDEWITACRGHQRRKYPYGSEYRQNECNVFRATHPAAFLHGDPSIGHLDPRLNQVVENGVPLLKLTGIVEACRSDWDADAVYDMVGNLDEWIDDPQGTFVGGFYARNTREGCDARVEVHPPEYFDYSLGTRCCK